MDIFIKSAYIDKQLYILYHIVVNIPINFLAFSNYFG